MDALQTISGKLALLLKEKGINRFAYWIVQKEERELNYENAAFSLYRTVFNNSVSLKVICDQKSGSASCNDFSAPALSGLVETAYSSAKSAPPDPAHDFAPFQEQETFRAGCAFPDMDLLFTRFSDLTASIGKEYPQIELMLSTAKHTAYKTLYVNSNGTELKKTGGAYTVMLEFSASDGEKNTGLDAVGVSLADLSAPLISCGNIRAHLADTVAQLSLVPSLGKFTGKVIFTPDCLAQFLGYLLENYAGDGVVLDGTGLWKDKVGQKVVDERISLTLSVSHPALVDPERITSDGYKSVDVPLIGKGVLKSLPIGLYTANKTGKTVCRNTGGNLVMACGGDALADMIASVDRGLLVGGFSGGMPGANGEFSGVAKNSFFIENGRIAGAVSETMINGNLGDMFSSVFGVSRESVADGETVLPWLGVDGIVISGK